MDETALLCESCGYSIERLETSGNCPECGLSIASSLPDARKGSPWQVRPSVFSWFRANLAALRGPRALFRSIRIERRSGSTLLAINLFIAAALAVDPWVGVFIGDPARSTRNASTPVWLLTYAATWLVETAVAALFLFALTRLEWYGIRFFSARRGWRLSRNAAWQVCCHASVGWIAVSFLPLLGMAWLYIFAEFFRVTPSGMLRWPPLIQKPIPWNVVVNFSVIVLGFFAGMLIFETLVYLGVRQCRYANAHAAPRHPEHERSAPSLSPAAVGPIPQSGTEDPA